MKHLKRHPLRAAAAAILASAPFMAHAGDGPYVGLEGGANWENPQNLRVGGAVADTLHFNTGWAAGLVGGYSFANGLRPELELDHRRNGVKNDSLGTSGIGGFENADSAMANLWYDFKQPSGLLSVIHPYLGVGLGGLRLGEHINTAGGSTSGHKTEFAYQGGAGLGYDITPHLTASVDYRYIESNRGSFTTAAGTTASARYRANTAMVGLRYSFGEKPAPVQEAAAPPPPPPPPPPPAPAPAPVCNPPAGFKVDANCHIIEQSLVIRSVDFENNSTKLTAPAQQSLDEVAGALKSQSDLKVEIQGHTDSVGSAPYNLKLSQKRADAVKAYLVSKGVDGSELAAKGYGKTKPIASNDTAEGRAQNRRVEFEVTNAPAHVKVQSEGATAASTEAAQGEQPKTVKKHHKKKKTAAPATADQSAQPQQ